MSFAGNPFTSAPRLSSPSKKNHRLSGLHARTQSRSPVRPRVVDTLLRDLSPTTTLRAFRTDPSSTDMAFGSTNADILARSIQSSSESERALGAKAAQACLDLRTWLREIEGWIWPGSFDVPEIVRKRMQVGDGSVTDENGEEYWGSLTARTVQAYEQRADQIGQMLDDMDVEELKEYVLSSHYRASSRPPSRNRRLSTMSTLDLVTSDIKRLDDFTALVTATILQALPFLTHLNRLLDVWTIRLMILRSAPQYLRDLHRARAELDQGWAAISASLADEVTIDRQTVSQLKSSFERQVGSLGRKLDRFLDDLEGREDRVPDVWIDDFEALESTYGVWVAQADRRVLESEWRRSRESQSAQTMVRGNEQSAELGVPSAHADAIGRSSAETSLSNDPFANFDQATDANMRSISPSIDAVPTIATRPDDLSLQHTNSNTRSISERMSLSVEDPASYRSVSDSAAQEEAGGSSIAKRRAAFLNDIERTNSLKLASKSPVRSFEHASNAFTKLFRKDRSPDKSRPVPRRSGSSRSGINGQLSTSGLAAPVRSPSSASSTRGAMERQDNAPTETAQLPSTGSQGRASGDQNADACMLLQRSTSPHVTVPEPVYKVQDAIGDGHSGPETYKPSRMSPPYDIQSREPEQLPADWPFAGQSQVTLNQDLQHQDESEAPFPHDERAIAVQSSEIEHMQQSDVSADSSAGEEAENTDLDPPRTRDFRDETISPTTPLHTDAFDRMFVETLPKAPSDTPGSVNAPERAAPWTGSRRRHSLPRPQRGGVPGLLRRSSVSSSYLDNGYTSTFSTMTETDSVTSPLSVKHLEPEEDERKWVKRASATFIEAFPRSELKSINVSRPSASSPRTSTSSSQTSPPRPVPETTSPVHSNKSVETIQAVDTSPTSNDNGAEGPSSPSSRSEYAIIEEHAAPQSTLSTATNLHIGESSPTANGDTDSPRQSAPLNAAMTKRRGKSIVNDENKAPMYTLSPAMPSKSTTQSRKGEDAFDRHVSELVNTLPAPIKFRSRAGAETPTNGFRSGEGRVSSGPRPKNAPSPRVPSRTGMVIAPAEPSPKKISSISDSEVKLYHLTQAGRDEPIKLFVRLVGEGERVMVRVGGGWADLADYLRQYAEHHGSRTVSDGGLELQTVMNGQTRRISNPPRTAPATPIPEAGSFRPASSDSEKDWSTNASPFTAREQTPSLYGTNTRSSTPKSSSGSSNSRPTTSNGVGGTGSSRPSSRQSNSARPSSRQSITAEGFGLAGPSSTGKRPALPDHKAKWVDSMIERAKASAEKSKESAAKEKYFGELGKAGGTRRLVFRSGSGTGTPEKK